MKRSLAFALAGVIVVGILGYLIFSDRLQEARPETGDVAGEAAASAVGSFTADQIATLSSLARIDDHPFYTLHFVGPYRGDITGGIQTRLSREVATPTTEIVEPPFACSLFVTYADSASPVLGRNFDWSYHPILLLFTSPPDGHASISFVDLSYFVSEDLVEALDGTSIESLRGLLETPFLPFDGMNELGLVVGMAAVPPAEMPIDPQKEMLGSIDVIRDILDYASSIEEALDILTNVNVDMTGGPHIHYLIADVAGHSAVVEFADGNTYIFRPEAPWQHMTNFRLKDVPEPDRADACWRFAAIADHMLAVEGLLTPNEAMALLESVRQASETKPAGTLWSAVYDMSGRTVHVAIRQRFDRVYTFTMP